MSFRRFFCDDDKLPTHLDLAGGKYHVMGKNDKGEKHSILFFEERAKRLQEGKIDCLSEIPTVIHPFHADVDAEVEKGASFPVLEISKAIQETLSEKEGVNSNKTALIVLTAPPAEKNGKMKHGIHVIAPEVKRDLAFDKEIVNESLSKIQHVLDSAGINLKANEIMDTSIYNGDRGVGMRMAFAHKAKKNDDDTKTIIDRQYTVFSVIKANGVIDDKRTRALQENKLLAMKMASIRHETTSDTIYKKKRKGTDIPFLDQSAGNMVDDDKRLLFKYASQIHPSFETAQIRPNGVSFVEKSEAKFSGFKFWTTQRLCPASGLIHGSSGMVLLLNKWGMLYASCSSPKRECARWKPPPVQVCQKCCDQFGLNAELGFPKPFLSFGP